MVPIRVREVLEATDGTLLCGDIESVITDVVTDSRSAKEGTLFVPVIGERVDAHRFIPDGSGGGSFVYVGSGYHGRDAGWDGAGIG